MLKGGIEFQTLRAKKRSVGFYSERTAWSSRAAPSEEIGPRIPGSFCKTEQEEK